MRSSTLYSLAACLSGALAAYNTTYTGYPPEYCVGKSSATNNTSPPNKWGIILFQAYEPLDVWGPYEALFTLARTTKVDISFLAETMDPVTTRPRMASMNKFNSSAFVSVPPTHTFATAPSDLEVLLVPGGAGARAPDADLKATMEFIKETYPKLKYLITVCTGSMVVARTGLLSGVRATTNKAAWQSVVATDPTAHWIPHARWAVDGNIWSSSGVSAGIDATLAWISCLYGDDIARNVTKDADLMANDSAMEYERHTDSYFDPFAELYNVTAPASAFS